MFVCVYVCVCSCMLIASWNLRGPLVSARCDVESAEGWKLKRHTHGCVLLVGGALIWELTMRPKFTHVHR